MTGAERPPSPRRASLFVTCLVDQFRPSVGWAAVKLLRRLGVEVDVPEEQTCCGQPAWNAGCSDEARAVARTFLDAFEKSDAVVVPSGSCASMIRVFYADLFADDPAALARARAVAAKTYELTEFIVKVLKVEDVGAAFSGTVTYHDACHLLRELRIQEEPRKLIAAVRGAKLAPLPGSDVCCGFGGTFAAGFPKLSAEIGKDKVEALKGTHADVALLCDTGCILHLESLKGDGGPRIRHLAELLADGLPSQEEGRA